jgi:hypothetical protein
VPLRSRPEASNWAGWDENRIFLEDDKLEVAVKIGRRVVAHLPAGRPPEETASRPSRWRVTVTTQNQGDVVTVAPSCEVTPSRLALN